MWYTREITHIKLLIEQFLIILYFADNARICCYINSPSIAERRRKSLSLRVPFSERQIDRSTHWARDSQSLTESARLFQADLQSRASRHNHVRRTNSDLGGQRLLQWDTRSGYVHNYRRMLSTPSPIKTRPPRLSPRHSSHDIVTLRRCVQLPQMRLMFKQPLSRTLH